MPAYTNPLDAKREQLAIELAELFMKIARATLHEMPARDGFAVFTRAVEIAKEATEFANQHFDRKRADEKYEQHFGKPPHTMDT